MFEWGRRLCRTHFSLLLSLPTAFPQPCSFYFSTRPCLPSNPLFCIQCPRFCVLLCSACLCLFNFVTGQGAHETLALSVWPPPSINTLTPANLFVTTLALSLASFFLLRSYWLLSLPGSFSFFSSFSLPLSLPLSPSLLFMAVYHISSEARDLGKEWVSFLLSFPFIYGDVMLGTGALHFVPFFFGLSTTLSISFFPPFPPHILSLSLSLSLFLSLFFFLPGHNIFPYEILFEYVIIMIQKIKC